MSPVLPYRAIIVLLLAAFTCLQPASAGQINFDNVANGTIIDTVYPGVAFGCVFCASNHAYARDMSSFGSTTAASEPNVVTLVPPFNPNDPNSSVLTSFNGSQGAVAVYFATPQKTVSIDARPQLPLEFFGTAQNKPFLEAYSSTTQNGSTFLGRVLYPLNFGSGGYCQPATSACGGPWQTLTFTSGSDNIVSLRLSSQISQPGPNVYADFDNLTFEATPPPVIPVPEATYCTDFNSGVPSGMTLFGHAAINGGYLKLTDNQEGRNGVAYLNDFNGGQRVTAFQATFKASLFGSCCAPFPADGFSFNLVSAATTPATPNLTLPIEEGLSNGLAISFDTWDNGGGEAPAIEVKWFNQSIAIVPFQASQSAVGATDPVTASRDVVITLDEDGTVDVSYGGTLVINNVQTPYNAAAIGAPKWVLGGRTGLSTDNHWIDDLCITARSGAKLCTDYNSSVPAGTTLFGDAQVNGGHLKLVTLPANAGFGIAYIDDFGRGDLVQGFHATFKAALFGSTCCDGFPADGFSFNLVPERTVLSNPAYAQPGEEGLDEGLSVTFDTWDNAGGEAPAIGVKWLGQTIVDVPFQASQSPAGATDFASAARDVVIDLKADGRMTVSYGATTIFNNIATPYDPAVIGVPKWVLGARIGLATDNHWFDDLCIATLPSSLRQIPDLFPTGVDVAGRALNDNAIDPHYVLTQGGTDAFAATSAGGFPIPPWIGDSTVSAWIAPSTSTDGPSAGTTYAYETKFDLTGFNPASARINGRWATDDRGIAIFLNGVSTGHANNTGFGSWSNLLITTGFVPGTNRLTFVVQNGNVGDPPGNDPTGLRAEVWGSASLDCAAARPSPRISVTRQSSQLILAWSGTGFVLQSASNVRGPWSDYTRGSSANGRDFTASVPASGSMRFFRLRFDCP